VVEDGQVPTGIDVGFDPDPRKGISKEWLESVINGNIKPRLSGVVINQVELTTERPGRVLYVVDIPQSIAGGPHQAKDHRYHKRFNFESVPMEDYEIRDVMRRALGPDLYCTIQIGERGRVEQLAIDQQFDMIIAVGNLSPEPALYAHFDLFLDKRLTFENWNSREFNLVRSDISCAIGDLGRAMHQYGMNWITSSGPPFWRGVEHQITRLPMSLSRREYSFEFFAVLILSAPHMTSKTFVYELQPTEPAPYRRVTLRDDIEFKEYER
jgi:hypothetical protein